MSKPGNTDPFEQGRAYSEGLSAGQRRALGAHYSEPALIALLIDPTLAAPLAARRAAATSAAHRDDALRALRALRVLDPAVGGGAFLIAALRVLRAEERALLAALGRPPESQLSLAQLAGIDVDEGALAVAREALLGEGAALGVGGAPQLLAGDALQIPWPDAQIILGNPPFIAKSRLRRVWGSEAVEALRARYPAVSGVADASVYWFYLANQRLPLGGRAGLIGTNTVRETHSRAAALDPIATDGRIVWAVPTMPWPGGAGVHVSLVSWVKGASEEESVLARWTPEGLEPQRGGPIHGGLSFAPDLSAARALPQNQLDKLCFQGVTPGHADLLLTEAQARVCAEDPVVAAHLHPYYTATDLTSGKAPRWILDLHPLTEEEVPQRARAHLEARLRPAREAAARAGGHHRYFLTHWWWPSWPRPALKGALSGLPRFLVMPRYATHSFVAALPATARPSDLLQAFALADDYSFGVLQSKFHREWAVARGSSLITTPRYTSSTVWETFPWPAAPSPTAVAEVVRAALAVMEARGADPRPLGAQLRSPDLLARDAQIALDAAVARAYGLGEDAEVLEALLALNLAGIGARPGPLGLDADARAQVG